MLMVMELEGVIGYRSGLDVGRVDRRVGVGERQQQRRRRCSMFGFWILCVCGAVVWPMLPLVTNVGTNILSVERLSSVNHTKKHESPASRLFTTFLQYSRLSVVRNSFEEWTKLLARHHTDSAFKKAFIILLSLPRYRVSAAVSISFLVLSIGYE
jgi:hypothetical protein